MEWTNVINWYYRNTGQVTLIALSQPLQKQGLASLIQTELGPQNLLIFLEAILVTLNLPNLFKFHLWTPISINNKFLSRGTMCKWDFTSVESQYITLIFSWK